MLMVLIAPSDGNISIRRSRTCLLVELRTDCSVNHLINVRLRDIALLWAAAHKLNF